MLSSRSSHACCLCSRPELGLWCSATAGAGGTARRWFRGNEGCGGAAPPALPRVSRSILACPCSSSNALPRTLCCCRLRLRDSCRVGGGRETAAGGRGSSKNPSNSTSSAIISHSHDLAALTDGTSHSPPRQRSRKVQDSIELVSKAQLRRNRLVRHSSTVCGGEPQNFTQSDRRHARPRKSDTLS